MMKLIKWLHVTFYTSYCLDSNNSYGENDSNKFVHLNFEKKILFFYL